ncbi:MAG: M48 family metalloprotease [bacterium]|nr:M48 family metalloprotease [bacterium]
MTIYNQIDANQRKTWLIMMFFSLFVVGASYVFTLALGYQGPSAVGFVGIFLIITGIINLASYYWSDRMVMAISGAKRIEKNEALELFRTIENLSIGAGIPMPKIYIINEAAPNAFATGRDPKHAAVAVTRGLLEKLDKLELEGVIAHELSHIQNYDSRLMTIVVILVGLVALLADFFMRAQFFGGRGDDRGKSGAIFVVIAIVAAILAPISAQLIQLSISRRREFLADASAALLTRYPEGLAKALEKIAEDRTSLKSASTATAHLYIENPFKKGQKGNWLTKLFMTHPPVEERVKALRSM